MVFSLGNFSESCSVKLTTKNKTMKKRIHLFCISVKDAGNTSGIDGEDDKVKDKLLMLIKSCYKMFYRGGLIMNLEKPYEIRQSDECGYKIYVAEMIPI